MSTFGSFYGLTASTLLLLDREVVEKLNNLTRTHSDEYTGAEMLEELIYMKKILSAENLSRVKRELLSKTEKKQAQKNYILQGVGEYLYLKHLEASSTNKEVLQSDSDEDLFADDSDLFEEEDADLFSEEDVDLFADDVSATRNKPLESHTAEELARLGVSSLNMTSLDLDVLSKELEEFEKYDNFFKLRFGNAGKGIVEAITSGTVSLRKFGDKEYLKAAVETPHISLFSLTVDQLSFVSNISKEIVDLEEIDSNDEELYAIPEFKMFMKLYDSAQKNIDYYIDMFEQKSAFAGKTKISIFNTPLTRVQYAFYDGQYADKVASIMRSILIEVPERHLELTTKALEDVRYLQKFINRLASDTVDNPVIKEKADILVSIIQDIFEKGKHNARSQEEVVMTEILKELISRGMIVEKNAESYSQERKQAIYVTYALYALNDNLALERLCEGYDFNQFMDMNHKLAKSFKVIPISSQQVYIDSVIQSFEPVGVLNKGMYTDIIPKLQWLEINLESMQRVGQYEGDLLAIVS